MEYFAAVQLAEMISTIVYTFLGVALMGAVWKVIDWLTPFPILKEIEQDQNMALAVLIGMLFVSISIIIAAVIVS
ncbi:DUF350 domain-containing protein [Phaeobacter sp. 11ANDIMAR09]|uniref:DUF350 domain-containing protein n=1 Tax=Phaeobacter sp. 11ANDIMAR09 TaxID=1225647 RepID=UPI0006C850EA|nr:DUF350 domain-containing protein [Phaeobacter sp. 11ANDIMAR09]KPD14020.1 hypothetical protein AN476_02245 [Phaeobacter sp. 11ANDIMAR09]OIQ35360.1 MAG: DUF350 domain-containing protein [Roseobacter sp. MedPE-SWchi]